MTEAEWLASDDPAAMLGFVRNPAHPGGMAGQPYVSDRKLRLFAAACYRDVAEAARGIADAGRAADNAEYWAENGRAAPGVRESSSPTEINDRAIDHATGAATWAQYHRGTRTPRELSAAQAALLRDIVGNPFRPPAFDPAWRTPDVLSLAAAAYSERGRQLGCLKCVGSIKQRVNELMRGGLWGDGIGPRNASFRINHEFDTSFTPEEVHRIWQVNQTGSHFPPDRVRCDCWVDDGTLSADRLAVLADALEDAGCPDGELLRHLRGREVVPATSGGVIQAMIDVPLRGPHVRGCHAIDVILGKP